MALGILAYYLEWHLREALVPLLLQEEQLHSIFAWFTNLCHLNWQQ